MKYLGSALIGVGITLVIVASLGLMILNDKMEEDIAWLCEQDNYQHEVCEDYIVDDEE